MRNQTWLNQRSPHYSRCIFLPRFWYSALPKNTCWIKSKLYILSYPNMLASLGLPWVFQCCICFSRVVYEASSPQIDIPGSKHVNITSLSYLLLLTWKLARHGLALRHCSSSSVILALYTFKPKSSSSLSNRLKATTFVGADLFKIIFWYFESSYIWFYCLSEINRKPVVLRYFPTHFFTSRQEEVVDL